MLSNFHILTLSHQEVPLERLSDAAIRYSDNDELQEKLEQKKIEHNLEELFYLSTCNRILYLFVTDQKVSKEFISQFIDTNPAGIRYLQGEEAIFYLFQVASSIHSMVVGEREIITQIRTTYEQQVGWGITGDNIRLAIQQTVRAAKKVYAATKIGTKPISVVSLAVRSILDFKLPHTASILLVGAGQTNKLVMTHLLKKGYKNISVFNRTLSKAKALASMAEGGAFDLSELEGYDAGFDCLVACTGAQEPTVTMEVAEALSNHSVSDKIWVDLGLPGDLDPLIEQQYPERVINLQALQEKAKVNLGFRRKEIKSANEILSVAVASFKELIYRRRIERAFRQIPVEIKSIKDKALLEVFRSDLEGMDDRTKAVVTKMMNYMEKRCISVPMKVARDASL